jgi:hypothetical protein
VSAGAAIRWAEAHAVATDLVGLLAVSARRFWLRAEPQASGCWMWTGATKQGYGAVTIGGRRSQYAHRVAFEMINGPIPDGMHIDHLCRNKLCIRPGHLEAVTQAENNARAVAWRPVVLHCRRGHLMDAANTYVRTDGTKRCRTCRSLRERSVRTLRFDPELLAAGAR